MTTRKPKKRQSGKTRKFMDQADEALAAIEGTRKSRTLADVARNVRPIPTVKQIEEALEHLSVSPPVSTRTLYDLVMAVCGLTMFFMVTHYFGWPV